MCVNLFKLCNLIFLFNIPFGRLQDDTEPKTLWSANEIDRLRQDLLLNYDKFSRPTQHSNLTVVQFGLTIRHIELDEVKSTLIVHSWLKLLWNDGKLKWDPEDYDGISTLHIADHEIWQPDIYLYNSATSSSINSYGSTQLVVYNDGDVLWIPPARLSSLCSVDIKYWPFDKHQCFLRFGSWTYKGDEVDLQVYNNDSEVTEGLLIENSEWEIINTSIVRHEINLIPETFPDIEVFLTIARRSEIYKAVVITPAIALIVITLVTFLLPPQAGEKIILNACAVLITCLFLLYFSLQLAGIGESTPLIVSFYGSLLYILSSSLFASVLVIWISRTKHIQSLPWALKQPLTGKFGKILGLTNYIKQTSLISHRVTAEEMRDHQVVTDMDEPNSCSDDTFVRRSKILPVQQDWVLLAAAIDRVLFIFNALVFGVLAILYSL